MSPSGRPGSLSLALSHAPPSCNQFSALLLLRFNLLILIFFLRVACLSHFCLCARGEGLRPLLLALADAGRLRLSRDTEASSQDGAKWCLWSAQRHRCLWQGEAVARQSRLAARRGKRAHPFGHHNRRWTTSGSGPTWAPSSRSSPSASLPS